MTEKTYDQDKFYEWLRNNGRSHNTASIYSRRIAGYHRVKFDIGNGNGSLIDWINHERAQDASAQKIKGLIAASRAYCKFLDISSDAFNGYIAPPIPPARAHPLPGGIDDARLMLKHAPGKWAKNLIALGALAGLRVSESISLMNEDVNFESMEITVKGKGDKIRRVPMSTELAAILGESPNVRSFVPLSNSRARAIINAVGLTCGIWHTDGKAVSSHDLRATFATTLYEKTGDLVLVQSLLGHSDTKQTLAYIGVNKLAARNGVEF